MDSSRQDEVVAEAAVSKWRKLVKQHSTVIGTLAGNVVLPKNERKLRRLSESNTAIEMKNIETEYPQTKVHIDEVQKTDEKKVEHFPIFMIGVSIVQIILFYSFDEDVLLLKLGYDPHRRHELWRFLTVMLAHSGYSHLWGNVVMQLVLGVFLEIVHKWKRIAVIYLASVIGGGLCTTVLDNEYYTVGASAGVMGLLFSHLATILLNWNEMDRKFTRLFCISLYIVYDTGSTVYNELYLKRTSSTSHAGHFGGAVTGFLVSILVLKNFKKLRWEDTMQKMCVGILVALFVIIFVINIIGADFPTNEWHFDYAKTYNNTNEVDEGNNYEVVDDDEGDDDDY